MANLSAGSNASIIAEVDNTPKALRSILYGPDGLPLIRSERGVAGASDYLMPIGGVNDMSYRIARMDRGGSLATTLFNSLFTEAFEGPSLANPQRWTQSATTFAPSQATASGLSLNSGSSTTSGAAALLSTNRRFLRMQRQPMHIRARARMGQVAGVVHEMGWGLPATNTASPTNGAYWQVTAGGAVQGVLSYNGTNVTTTDISTLLPTGWQNNFYVWDIWCDDDSVTFIVQDSSTGLILAEKSIAVPVGAVKIFADSRLPYFLRLHNTTAPASAPVFVVGSVDVLSLDAQHNRPWGVNASIQGLGSDIIPNIGGASTENNSNSAAPAPRTTRTRRLRRQPRSPTPPPAMRLSAASSNTMRSREPKPTTRCSPTWSPLRSPSS